MNDFLQSLEIRWSDLDPNFHLRHSVYYDFGAFSRIAFLASQGITSQVMFDNQIGPVLFREECIFRKEIRLGDKVSINVKLDKLKADFSRWIFVHEIFKNNDQLAATITVDGAWFDTQKRKLVVPGGIFLTAFEVIAKTDSFQLL